MKKFFNYAALIFIIVFFGCESGTQNRINSLSKEGKESLSTGDYEGAKGKFSEILSLDGSHCDGLYGMLLGEMMAFIDSVYGYIDLTNSITGNQSAQSGLRLQQAGVVDGVIYEVANIFLDYFKNLDFYAVRVKEMKCSFSLSMLPISRSGIEFRGEWDEHEAHFISMLSNGGKAIVNFLIAHNLDVNTVPIRGARDSGLLKFNPEDVVVFLRSVGFIVETSPELLKWSTNAVRRASFDAVPQYCAAMFHEAKELLNIFTEQDKTPYDDIIAWVDVDNDGIPSSGDKLILNVYKMDTGEPAVDLSGYTGIFLPILASSMDDWRAKITRVEDAFAFRLSSGERISFDEILPWFGSMLGISNTLEFDIIALFKGMDYTGENVRPLRDLLPYLFDHDGNSSTYQIFLVEGEIFGTPLQGKEGYLFNGDAKHFGIGTDWNPSDTSIDHASGEIKPDCAVPNQTGVQIGIDSYGNPVYLPLIYGGWPDPSFNGAVYTNDGGTCADSSQFSKTTVYSLNKELNRLIAGWGNFFYAVVAGGVSF